jgi:NarL family two-component system response regulator LiaR
MWSSDIVFEMYVGIVAVIGTGIGLWVAMRFSNSKTDLQKLEALPLTTREHDVLQLLSQGMSNAEIADKLFLSLSTVKREVSGLFLKMDVKNRAEAQRKYSHFSRKL